MSTIIRIPLHSLKHPGMFALIDEADESLIAPYHWHVVRDGRTFYAVRTWQEGPRKIRKQHTVRMHRMILAGPAGMPIDHIDRDGLNNTRSNLRICTPLENSGNRRKAITNSSGYIGVTFFRRTGKWKSTIMHAGRPIHLGYHATAEAAARAYDDAALRLRGDFAQLNFPPTLV